MNIKKFLICMIIFLIFSYLHANPIQLRFINELYFDTTGWFIELNPVMYFETLDSCYLTSLSDTAYFKNGISHYYDEFTVFIKANNSAVNGADVEFNGIIKQTDIYGRVTFVAPEINQTADFVISASKPGYFNGSKNITCAWKRGTSPRCGRWR